MSRNIDLTQPLSDEDRQYLEDRGRHRDVELADGNYHANTPDDSVVGLQEQSPAATPANVGAQNADPVPAPDPDLLASPVTDHTAEDSDESDDEDDEDEDNYDDDVAWKFQDLRTEATERELSAGGSREDIIARLREYDRTH